MNALKRICHWGPLTALAIVKTVTGATIYCNSQWWPPANSIGGALNSGLFLLLSSLTIINFFTSVYDGPGFLPLKWQPSDNNTKYLQYCYTCLGYKAPRSHHCRKCDRCVLKMDHHCPWINTCVGHKNHAHFTLFIFFAVCGCIHSTIILSCTLYHAISRGWYIHYSHNLGTIVNLGLYGFVLCVFALGLSIGVVLAVGALLFFQLRAIIKNRTAIEDWILEKANYRRLVAEARGEKMAPFIYPYHLGTMENIRQVLNWQMMPVGDGITWNIASHLDCDQYTLTREQIEQKAEKRQRAKAYSVIKTYSGSWCPVVFGCRVLLSPPLTDEHRLPLSVGDYLLVTRWRKYWLFGEKLKKGQNGVNMKGWFPRPCVIEVTGDVGDSVVDQDKKIS
ncbi:UNVERIFIED_CONTAM: hypothetical protein PYX00_002518 [Menopon gallinae]|uniref:Palmitoyltransferase n=1 Tax=Menopon gallinae TaxID=328185 RepID=A0AAW2II02_9NEOP